MTQKQMPPLFKAADIPVFSWESLRVGTMTTDLMERERLIPRMGFVRLTEEVVDYLVALCQGKRVADVGAGTGYLARQLELRCVDVTAIDIHKGARCGYYGTVTVWKRDLTCDALSVLPGNFEIVILSWPTLGSDFAADVARALRPEQILIYEGEYQGGCTANAAFFEEMEKPHWKRLDAVENSLNERHRQWWGIHDVWMVWQRTPAALTTK